MLKELSKFKDLLLEKKAIEKEILEQTQKKETIDKKISRLLNRTLSVHKIIVKKLPESEEIILESIVKALNKCKRPWIKFIIFDELLRDIFIIGRVRDILNDKERIARMASLRQESMIGLVRISLDSKLSFENLI